MGGCKVASIATFKAYLCTSFVVVYYWVVGVFLYLWRVVPFRGVGGCVGWGAGGGGAGGVVVLVVVEVGRPIPPFDGL